MGVHGGPKAAAPDGLVLALDAGNSKGFDDDENLLLYSNFSFSSITAYPTGWTSFNPGRVVRSIGQSPDGTDAAIVGKQFGNSGGFRPNAVTLSASTNYTVSFYARKPTDSELSLFLSYFPTNDTTTQPYTKGVRIRYDDADTSTGSTGSTSFTLTDTWQRFTYTFNSGSDTAISPNFTSLTVTDAYDSNGLFVIASVQVERGSLASPYYATTASAKSRGSTLIDLTGRGNTGTLTNGPTYNSTSGGAIVFDGSNDCVVVNSNASVLSNTAYTKNVWFYVISFASNNNLISGGNNGRHVFWLGGTNKLQAGHNSTWNTISSSTSLSLNTWYNAAVTFSTTTGWCLYLNGVLDSTNSSTSTVFSAYDVTDALFAEVPYGVGYGATTSFIGSGEILIGAYGTGSNGFNGRISNASVYNRVLSASEISQNFIATKSRFGL